ncbi:MAG: mechanosensitive ion channel [Desulfobacterales bacterium]|nr:MAG: mechanosensitive ion channel [Desulfobacterales bacterium]
MMKPSLKLAAAVLAVIVITTVPEKSISQRENQGAAGAGNSGIGAEAPAGMRLDELKKWRSAAENAGDLAEDVKKSVLSYLDRAILFREREAQLRDETENVRQRAKAAPERIKAIEAELDRPLTPPDDVVAAAGKMKPDQIEQHLRKMEVDLSDAGNDLNKLSEQLKSLKEQPANLPQEIANAKKRLMEIGEELKAGSAPDEPLPVTKARQVALSAEQSRIETEINTFESRLANHDALTALVAAERDLAARKVARQESLVKSWQAEVQRIRELEAKQDLAVAEQAKNIAVDLPPDIQKQFDVNIELGKMLEKVTAEEAQVAESLKLKQAQLKQIEEEFALAREQVKYPMHTETIGLALREQRRGLPSIANFRRNSNRRQVQMGEIRSIQLDLERQRRELADPDLAMDRIIQRQTLPSGTDTEVLKTELRRLLTDRRELVRKLQTGCQRLFKNLQSLEFIEQQVAAKAEEEARFLDEHLLWIRSAKSVGLQDLRNLPEVLQWLLSPLNWWQVVQDWQRSIMRNPLIWMLALLISFVFMGLRQRAHQDLSRVARRVYSVKTDSFILTLRALALTGRVALGWPLLMLFAGWQLVKLPSSQDFSQVVANGLIFAAQTLAGGLLMYEFCWKEGVAKVHFKWPESVRRSLRHSLQWFILLLVTMSFTIIAVQTKNDAVYTDSLGRLALIALMAGFSLWAAYMLRFSGEIVSMLTRRRREGWLVRLRFIWYPLAVGVPLVLAVLAGIGYYYSAFALYLRLGETIALILGLIIVKDLVLRWLFITQRRLAFEEIRRKTAARAEKPEKEETAGAGEGEGVSIEEPEINLDQIYEKNRALLRTLMFFSALIGLWLIWANVLPALNFLENVQLWSYSSEVEGVRTIVPITLADLMIAVIVAMVTVVAAKNLPSLLEIILLNWFPVDAGLRHAISTIFNYMITAIGIVVAFTVIGIKWSSIQWLIAALGVGVGFGLQEIVANFICGLIVLFERPFRIGDTVTIGDVSGTVTRIQIRATTVMDWDRKELIVPNKEFITGRLINWSLSDNVIRIKIPIGIAYGSDTNLAEELMLKAAKANSLVLRQPEPQAVFLGFGDNSLNFELRVFINGINDWIPMLHKLNQTVDQEFRKAGVTISFPQRDVHLDQIGPLEVRVVTAS